MTEEVAKCQLCGEPMQKGEEMFNFHGSMGPCPKPPLPKEAPLDGKFHGRVFRNKDGVEEPPDSWIVFVARDNALPRTLEFYRQECIRLGAEWAQIEAVEKLILRVEAWRAANPTATKIPDVESGELAW